MRNSVKDLLSVEENTFCFLFACRFTSKTETTGNCCVICKIYKEFQIKGLTLVPNFIVGFI